MKLKKQEIIKMMESRMAEAEDRMSNLKGTKHRQEIEVLRFEDGIHRALKAVDTAMQGSSTLLSIL